MEKQSCRTYFKICPTVFMANDVLIGLLGFPPESKNDEYVIGYNEQFDIDVNNMLRVTLKELFGKEEAIRKICKLCAGTAYLEIVPCLVHDSPEPSQILSLDPDIIEFLYKSGTRLDLDYYII